MNKLRALKQRKSPRTTNNIHIGHYSSSLNWTQKMLHVNKCWIFSALFVCKIFKIKLYCLTIAFVGSIKYFDDKLVAAVGGVFFIYVCENLLVVIDGDEVADVSICFSKLFNSKRSSKKFLNSSRRRLKSSLITLLSHLGIFVVGHVPNLINQL